MTNENGRSEEENNRRKSEKLGALIEALVDNPLDVSWLCDADFFAFDLLEQFILLRSLKDIEKEPDEMAEGRLYQAQSAARAISMTLNACSRCGYEDQSLLTILQALSDIAYEGGVRDAYEGKLPNQYQRKLADSCNRRDKYADKMRELYEDIDAV